ncbi:MAG: hypothetical protein LBM97_01515 [Candidatus Nomurabacteria bacterium]|nr:hypothetical protein [Candidatus Nomurabacteria bacterium]
MGKKKIISNEEVTEIRSASTKLDDQVFSMVNDIPKAQRHLFGNRLLENLQTMQTKIITLCEFSAHLDTKRRVRMITESINALEYLRREVIAHSKIGTIPQKYQPNFAATTSKLKSVLIRFRAKLDSAYAGGEKDIYDPEASE